jgi:hypothetical protein
MSRGTFLTIIVAMIAGAFGFGIAVYAVPLEEIVQFRALISAVFGENSMTNHAINGKTGVEHPVAPSSKASREPESSTRDRSDANSNCDPHYANCEGGSPTEASSPSDILNPRSATQNSPTSEGRGSPQAAHRDTEPAKLPSLSPNAGSEKAHVAPVGHSKRSAK